MNASKSLTITQLFNLAICIFGVQFASSLQMANMSSIYKFFGVSSGELPFLWLAAPLAGLIIQPLIGQLSDNTVTKYGRRRPYIFGFGILAAICFFFLPFISHVWLIVILFWIIFCSINGMTESSRALIGDITPYQQQALALSWQTVMAGMGASLAAASPWLLEKLVKLPRITNFNLIPTSLKLAFLVAGIVLLSCMLWTFFKVKEEAVLSTKLNLEPFSSNKKPLQKAVGACQKMILSIKETPLIIRNFFIVQIFTWFGVFIIWLYLTLAIAQHKYGLPPGVDVTNNTNYAHILKISTIKTDFYYAIYQFVSVLYAFFLPYLAKNFSAKLIHAASLLIGGLGVIGIGLVSNEWLLICCIITMGLMWGSIMTIPYVIILADLPRKKIGLYLGLFNITITLPQIFTGLFLGFLHSVIFQQHAVYTVMFAGLCILLAGLTLMIQIKQEAKLNQGAQHLISKILK